MSSARLEKRIARVKGKVVPLLQRFGVRRASLFGSCVRMDFSRASDIDLLVEVPAGTSLLDLVRLERELKARLGRRVDIVTFASVNPLLKDVIASEEVPIFP